MCLLSKLCCGSVAMFETQQVQLIGRFDHSSSWYCPRRRLNSNLFVGTMAVSRMLSQQYRLGQTAYIWRFANNQTGNRFATTSIPPVQEEPATKTEESESKNAQPEDRSKLLVLGGSGFVGSHVCKAAVERGLSVVSLSRSGKPALQESWTSYVTWVRGNLFEPDKWKDSLNEVAAVISCVGGFGSNQTMRKINGDVNINAINEAHATGVKRFVYISAFDFGFTSFILRGYYEGKRAAENALQEKFPYGGVILRPGFIHGTRQVGNYQIPLSVIGGPLETVLRNAKGASQIPLIGPMFIPPVKVTAVAKTAVRAAVDNAVPPGILDVWGIIRLGES